jgi:hypothetical protein
MKKTNLDSQKLSYVQSLLGAFKERYTGKDKAVKTADLLFHLKAAGKCNLSPQTLRELVGYIRQHDLLAPAFIVSNVNTGYWLTLDKSEMDGYIDQELNRMSNQFGNLEMLHQRIRYGKKKGSESQTALSL